MTCWLAAITFLLAPQAPPAPETQAARQFMFRLVREFPDALTDELRPALNNAFNAYLKADTEAPAFLALLRRMPGLIGVRSGESMEGAIEVPFGAMPALIYREGAGHLQFAWRKIAVAERNDPVVIEVGAAGPVFCGIELTNAPPAPKSIAVVLRSPGQPDARVNLRVSAAPEVMLTVALETGGKPTEATAALYSHGKRLIAPATALNVFEGGEGYSNVNHIYNRTSRYWPGKDDFVRSFYHSGAFTVRVPPATYRLMAAKGPEFEPVDRTVTVRPGTAQLEKVDLRRWTDMGARGWYSGDCHVHYQRKHPGVNEAVKLWARAEDVRMINVMAMGDPKFTYFEQYAWGKAGWHVDGDVAIVPGQEEPRTGVLGHTIQLNLKSFIRYMPESYYLYSRVFDETHRQGGLTGYVHVNNPLFNVNRGLTLDVPFGRVDFAEFCEAGNVKPALYYEFLNLGYALIAAGGSDVPYYGSIGDSRTYVYIDGKFSPEAWLKSFAAGHTFVTAGPMLEFSVAGHIAGDRITAKPGDTLRIRAKAESGKGVADPERLEIVVNGGVVRAAETAERRAALEFDLPVRESMWIAARSARAHTTPVYVTVNGARHWNRAEVPALIAKRLRTLDETEKLIGTTLPEGERILWESTEVFARDARALREAIELARQHYRKLLAELER